MKNKTAIISGASKGVGFELAIQLLSKGTKIACCARNVDSLQAYCQENKIPKEQYLLQTVDVKNEDEILAFTTASKTLFGEIDFLFNNVGMNTAKANIFEIATKDYDDMYAVNMRAPMIFTREVSKQMIATKTKGAIINLHSSCCLFSNPSIGSYTATKSGFDALSKVFRKELRDDEIKVLNVYPGGIDTPFREMDRPDYLDPKNVATTIITQLELPSEIYMDDIILRPNVERNF